MDAVLIVDEDVILPLIVDAEGNTMLTAIGTGELPEPGAYMSFEVRKKPEFNNTTNEEANACGATLDENIYALMDALLTDDDQTALALGSTINVYLNVSDIDNSVPMNEVSIIISTATHNNATIGKHFDIDLMKQIDSAIPGNITETNAPVTITLEVPDSLINSNASITRTYMMIRVHGGGAVTNVLPCTYDAASKTVSFETDKFSTYVLIYSDQQNSSGGTGSGSTSTGSVGTADSNQATVSAVKATGKVKDAVPKTGDESNVFMWFMLALVSGMGAIYFGKKSFLSKR